MGAAAAAAAPCRYRLKLGFNGVRHMLLCSFCSDASQTQSPAHPLGMLLVCGLWLARVRCCLLSFGSMIQGLSSQKRLHCKCGKYVARVYAYISFFPSATTFITACECDYNLDERWPCRKNRTRQDHITHRHIVQRCPPTRRQDPECTRSLSPSLSVQRTLVLRFSAFA